MNSNNVSFQQLVIDLTQIIGRKLTAYIAGADDTRSVDAWIQGEAAHEDIERKLRFTHELVTTLTAYDSRSVAQAWLMGITPELGDRTPIRLLRDGDLEVVGPDLLRAAQSFISGG